MYCQMAFEQLNVPGFSVLPNPLASLFALNATTGIILHIGRTTSEVSIIVDSLVRWECSTTVEIGQEDCEAWFIDLLNRDESLETELRAAVGEGWDEATKQRLVREVAEFVWKECTGDDIEVPPAQVASKAFVAATQPAPEGDEGDFDVAKK
jgi:actin-related protein 9